MVGKVVKVFAALNGHSIASLPSFLEGPCAAKLLRARGVYLKKTEIVEEDEIVENNDVLLGSSVPEEPEENIKMDSEKKIIMDPVMERLKAAQERMDFEKELIQRQRDLKQKNWQSTTDPPTTEPATSFWSNDNALRPHALPSPNPSGRVVAGGLPPDIGRSSSTELGLPLFSRSTKSSRS